MSRVVCWFSCGATSAIAAKLAVQEYAGQDIHLVYIDTGSEHPDNMRFLRDIEKWVGLPVEIIRSKEYKDTWDVFERTRWLVGVGGARCTTELKKIPRREYQRLDDIQVYGFDADEKGRAERFRANNLEVDLRTPLIERGLTKSDCLAMLIRAGIELPAMYRLGFTNANCIGCVKGQAGYWNRIRKAFPEVFDRMAKMERTIGAAINKKYVDGKRVRVFLDELPIDAGRNDEPMAECSLLCVDAEQEIASPSSTRKGEPHDR